jgi:hypothetical protein
MGIWCLLAFMKTSDPFVQIFAFSMTLAYMIGISGRNFASNLLVTAQIVCAGIPMTIALFSVGGAYYWIFAFVLVPFFVTLKFISDRLVGSLGRVANQDMSLLAGQRYGAQQRTAVHVRRRAPHRRLQQAPGALRRWRLRRTGPCVSSPGPACAAPSRERGERLLAELEKRPGTRGEALEPIQSVFSPDVPPEADGALA